MLTLLNSRCSERRCKIDKLVIHNDVNVDNSIIQNHNDVDVVDATVFLLSIQNQSKFNVVDPTMSLSSIHRENVVVQTKLGTASKRSSASPAPAPLQRAAHSARPVHDCAQLDCTHPSRDSFGSASCTMRSADSE